MRVLRGTIADSQLRSSRTSSLAQSRRCFQSRGPAPRIVAMQAKKAAPEAPLPQLTRPKPASAAQQAQAQPPASAAALADAYQRAADAKACGEVVEVKVVGQNEGGVMVQYGPLRGFIPYNQMDPARLRACTNGDLSTLTGQQLKARVVTADPSRKELVLSERQVAAAEALSRIQQGEVLTCVVTAVEDYGAFVQVKGMPEVVGLVHKSEVSWDRIMTVDQVVVPGQEVSAKVLFVDTSNCRLSLSVKQTSADPLRLSLEGLAWEAATGATAGAVDARVQGLVEALAGSEGVDSVTTTRVAQDPHHVAQELEVYLVRSEREGEGEYTAVARLGVGATELQLRAAQLSREQVKLLLQRVASNSAAQ